MKIIVANQAEKDLITRLFNAMHEFGILEYIHKETTKDTSPRDGTVNDDDFIIWSNEADILREEICYPRIEIDKNESDIKVEGELVTGTCRFCGITTRGIGEDSEGCTYEEYVDYQSQESQNNWRCTECESRICECCGEKLTDNDDETECADCLTSKAEVKP
ncbi:hypothetical protein [Pelosinus propionicus]|uniref:Uncharacterized protein n=1 Tax=Pelosinus propionicus DSM 13327 TaxID=1123291 RepID=A0A1I4N1U7_9FIRM|nr:hypothetical protein [Pelosinus propionicus]SFM09552.1 hypothetical protein SAMN04490355_104048 [Pelosinus propionicus DSM 13327]